MEGSARYSNMHPSINNCTIQIVCKAKDKATYGKLKKVLDYFGFITNLYVYDYNGRGELSAPSLKKNNFIFTSDSDEYNKIVGIIESNSGASKPVCPWFPDEFELDYSFCEEFFSYMGKWFRDERFLALVQLRLEMLSDNEPDYEYYLNLAYSLAYDSPCWDYFCFKLKLDAIEEYKWGKDAYRMLAEGLEDYLAVRGAVSPKAWYLLAQVLDYDLNDYKHAAEVYRVLLGYVKDNSSFYYSYASVLMKMERPELVSEIVFSLNKALQYDPASHKALYKLSLLNRYLGNLDDERSYLKNIVGVLKDCCNNGYLVDNEKEYYDYAMSRLTHARGCYA